MVDMHKSWRLMIRTRNNYKYRRRKSLGDTQAAALESHLYWQRRRQTILKSLENMETIASTRTVSALRADTLQPGCACTTATSHSSTSSSSTTWSSIVDVIAKYCIAGTAALAAVFRPVWGGGSTRGWRAQHSVTVSLGLPRALGPMGPQGPNGSPRSQWVHGPVGPWAPPGFPWGPPHGIPWPPQGPHGPH